MLLQDSRQPLGLTRPTVALTRKPAAQQELLKRGRPKAGMQKKHTQSADLWINGAPKNGLFLYLRMMIYDDMWMVIRDGYPLVMDNLILSATYALHHSSQRRGCGCAHTDMSTSRTCHAMTMDEETTTKPNDQMIIDRSSKPNHWGTWLIDNSISLTSMYHILIMRTAYWPRISIIARNHDMLGIPSIFLL